MSTPAEIKAKEAAEKAKLIEKFDRGAELSWSDILVSPVFFSGRAIGIHPIRVVTWIGVIGGSMFLLSMCNGAITGRGAQVNDVGDLVNPGTWGAAIGAPINSTVRGVNQNVVDPINQSFRTGMPAEIRFAQPAGDPTLISPPATAVPPARR